MAFMQKDDAGVVITVTIYEEDGVTPYDLSGVDSNTMEMWLGPPAGDAIQLTNSDSVTIPAPASQGKVRYPVQADVVTIAGTWNIQCKWEESGLTRHSTVITMDVYQNIED